MSKTKKKKQKIRIYFKDGKTDIIPQRFWDDYMYADGLFRRDQEGRMDRHIQHGYRRLHRCRLIDIYLHIILLTRTSQTAMWRPFWYHPVKRCSLLESCPERGQHPLVPFHGRLCP